MEIVHEEWRPVLGYEGQYEVSSIGRVRSLNRIVMNRGKGVAKPGKHLTPHLSMFGYFNVRLGGRTVSVHRLVLESFVGPCPPGMEACHFPDPTRTNNAISNLRWDTRSANYGDRVPHGTVTNGERNGRAKLTEENVREILLSSERGSDLARKFNVSHAAVYEIRKGRNWAHLQPAVQR